MQRVLEVGYIEGGVTLEGTSCPLKVGQYFCTICITTHEETSKIGRLHLQYRAGNSPIKYKAPLSIG